MWRNSRRIKLKFDQKGSTLLFSLLFIVIIIFTAVASLSLNNQQSLLYVPKAQIASAHPTTPTRTRTPTPRCILSGRACGSIPCCTRYCNRSTNLCSAPPTITPTPAWNDTTPCRDLPRLGECESGTLKTEINCSGDYTVTTKKIVITDCRSGINDERCRGTHIVQTREYTPLRCADGSACQNCPNSNYWCRNGTTCVAP